MELKATASRNAVCPGHLILPVAKPWGGRRRETVVEGRGSATSPVVGASRRHFPIAARQGGSPPKSRLRPHVDAAYPSRSEEPTSELQSLMRISYAAFCLKTKKKKTTTQ